MVDLMAYTPFPPVARGTRIVAAGEARSVCSRGNYRQQDAGGVRGIEVNRVLGDPPAAVVVERLAGIGVHIEARKVAARDVEADAVAAPEEERGRIHLDGELVRLPGLKHLRLRRPVPVA